MSLSPSPTAPAAKAVINVLHLEDDPLDILRVQRALGQPCQGTTFRLTSVATVDQYLERLGAGMPLDVVLLDISISGGDELRSGIDVARLTRERQPQLVVIMRSNASDAGWITDALKAGADDFISKTSDHGELGPRLVHAYHLALIKNGMAQPQQAAGPQKDPPPVAGRTMRQILAQIPRVIDSAIRSVFIYGESGVGKEVVADLFQHFLPPSVPFVRINCGSLTPSLMESELFGHVKGSFTGATSDKIGHIERASGGFIFLDEVATLSRSAQVALLRVIENQEVVPVGGSAPRKVNVRFLSATNEDLEKLIARGEFRPDLWQRLYEKVFVIPPLRDRRGEIRELIELFCRTMPGGPFVITEPTVQVLCSLPWSSGNVRELRNCLRAMTEYHVGHVLSPLSLPQRLIAHQGTALPQGIPLIQPLTPQGELPPPAGATGAPRRLSLDLDPGDPYNHPRLSDRLLVQLLQMVRERHGDVSLRKLAKLVGIPRTTLAVKLKQLHGAGALPDGDYASVLEGLEKPQTLA